jgi:hypothetical protein
MAASKIESEKALLKDLFQQFWFRIPVYQRPYVWGREQIDDLLDDLTYAQQHAPTDQYFLGSTVLQKNEITKERTYEEYDVLDGQQRMTTLLLLLAVLRDRTDDDDVKSELTPFIHKKGSKTLQTPGRLRIVAENRADVSQFMAEYVEKDGGTQQSAKLLQLRTDKQEDTSVRNMARAVLEIHIYFDRHPEVEAGAFSGFLLRQVLLIYVATENLDDAFRLFTILNNRGMPLRNSDILKAQNLGELTAESDKTQYAKFWEQMDSELGDDIDRFLAYLRTILVKDKARLGLVKEFEERVFGGKNSKPLLAKGLPMLKFTQQYKKYYDQLFTGDNPLEGQGYSFDNLLAVMQEGLPGTDWVPPLLLFYDKFRTNELLAFLLLLDNKFSADLMLGEAPTTRIENMNIILRAIEAASSAQEIVEDASLFAYNLSDLEQVLRGKVYGRRFAKYLLLKLDYLLHDHLVARIRLGGSISIEHILPQNPAGNSQWVKDFSQEDRNAYTNWLGNMVLIGRGKNASLGRLDFSEKTKRYFSSSISVSPQSQRVLHNRKQWLPTDLVDNQKEIINTVSSGYGYTGERDNPAVTLQPALLIRVGLYRGKVRVKAEF